MPKTHLFTSESVCAGHPDKICDQISDAIVDAVLAQDKYGRVAIETLVTTNQVVLAGEITFNGKVDYEQIARDQITRLDYTDKNYGFSNRAKILTLIHEQSHEISEGVDNAGAGDQGMMFGYACNETKTFMPLPIALAQALAAKIDEVRIDKTLAYLRPDGKTQVTVRYEDDKPIAIDKVVVAVPHDPKIGLDEVKAAVYQKIVCPVLAEFGFTVTIDNLIVNGTGVWHNGGPASDTGVTGRKIVVDTYGGYARVGGGCFSGKDPTKVDRSGAYAARYIAKNIVAQGLADRAEVALAYCIGQAQPVMKNVDTFGTLKVSQKKLDTFVAELLDCSVKGILTGLKLRRPIYLKTAAHGHFGRPEFPWEKVVK
jgi:S-adenosylmethionine synthetase